MFWLMTALMRWSGGADMPPKIVLIWVGVVFISILIHELGHAVAFRYFGSDASIVLYQFGGLAIPTHSPRGVWQRVAVAFAGPAAGFLFAFLILILLAATGHRIEFELDWIPFIWSRISEENAAIAVDDLMFVNIYWGLFNLLPIYPLDGGQISRNLLMRYDYRDGLRNSHMLSVVTAVAVAAYVWFDSEGQRPLTVLMLGFLAFQNYQEMSSPWNSRSPW